jgi:hypothetical protein
MSYATAVVRERLSSTYALLLQRRRCSVVQRCRQEANLAESYKYDGHSHDVGCSCKYAGPFVTCIAGPHWSLSSNPASPDDATKMFFLTLIR